MEEWWLHTVVVVTVPTTFQTLTMIHANFSSHTFKSSSFNNSTIATSIKSKITTYTEVSNPRFYLTIASSSKTNTCEWCLFHQDTFTGSHSQYGNFRDLKYRPWKTFYLKQLITTPTMYIKYANTASLGGQSPLSFNLSLFSTFHILGPVACKLQAHFLFLPLVLFPMFASVIKSKV